MSSLIETIATRQRAHSADNAAIRPFRVSVPLKPELTDWRQANHCDQCLAMEQSLRID